MPYSKDQRILILGAGLAGLAAGQRLKELGYQAELYEKNIYVGGRSRSHLTNGFTFDEGPHISFTERSEIKHLFAESTRGKFLDQSAVISNYWRGYFLPHPVQCNLYGLPQPLIKRCLEEFIKALNKKDHHIDTYADWCYQKFGQAISEEFLFRYTRKYWTTEASNISIDWLGQRIYSPNLEEVVKGASAPNTDKCHYLTRFRYPLKGGFGAFTEALAKDQQIHLGHEVVSIDLDHHELEFSNGKREQYDSLISSLPLPEFIRKVKNAPNEVIEAANQLACTSLILVNIGINRNKGFPDAHWMYIYDEDIIFARVNFPHYLSPNNTPPGCGSIQAEIYYSKYKQFSCKNVLERSISDMKRIGILRKNDDIMVAYEQHIPYANVLFDLKRAQNLPLIQAYLNDQNVICCGRYGEWAYYWSDDSILSGKRAAEKAVI